MLRLLKTSALQSTRSRVLYFHSATFLKMADKPKSPEWVQPPKGDEPMLKVYNSLTKSKVLFDLVSDIALLILVIRQNLSLRKAGM